MQFLTSIFLTLVVLFGIGTPRHQLPSEQFQAGNWDGHRIGFIRTAEVKDGVLYIDGEFSHFPADSSKPYWMPPVISTEKGTWFADAFSDYGFDLVMRLDKRGENIMSINFAPMISKIPTKKVKVKLSEDQSKIMVVIYAKSGDLVTYSFFVDPDECGRPKEAGDCEPEDFPELLVVREESSAA